MRAIHIICIFILIISTHILLNPRQCQAHHKQNPFQNIRRTPYDDSVKETFAVRKNKVKRNKKNKK